MSVVDGPSRSARIDEPPRRTHAESWDWRGGARCRGEDVALFFHPDGERGQARSRRQQLAKQICAQCPVIAQCRSHSLTFQEPFGTWGGLAEDERSRLLPARAVNLRTHRARAQTPVADPQGTDCIETGPPPAVTHQAGCGGKGHFAPMPLD
ncbi:WhiB family transcriptional regulator [Mycolicibacterium sp. P9-64]|nr:WhiB family transcriptional regulator [Mycolicibacterium sp. P9-64]